MFAYARSWPLTGSPLARQTGLLFTAVRLSLQYLRKSILNYHTGLGQSLCTILWRKQQWAKSDRSRHQPNEILPESLRWACWIQSGLANEPASLDFDTFPLDTQFGLPTSFVVAPTGTKLAAKAGSSTPVLHETDWMIWNVTTNANTTTHIAGLIGVWYVSARHLLCLEQ